MEASLGLVCLLGRCAQQMWDSDMAEFGRCQTCCWLFKQVDKHFPCGFLQRLRRPFVVSNKHAFLKLHDFQDPSFHAADTFPVLS